MFIDACQHEIGSLCLDDRLVNANAGDELTQEMAIEEPVSATAKEGFHMRTEREKIQLIDMACRDQAARRFKMGRGEIFLPHDHGVAALHGKMKQIGRIAIVGMDQQQGAA